MDDSSLRPVCCDFVRRSGQINAGMVADGGASCGGREGGQRSGDNVTYFSGAFVFDDELALLLAVIDVAQLVVKQVRGG